MEKVLFHVDLDAFYASVEQADYPEYKNKPVIIGALPGHRGVVAACSYEARKFGIHSAMPISQAYRRCKRGIYLIPRMERYHELSEAVMQILAQFTPKMQQLSIDEASMDMTGTDRLFGSPESIAEELKTKVRNSVDLSISVGIAPNRYLAKLASEFDKPDGLFRVLLGKEESFLDKLGLKDLWGLGSKMRERLEELNITSVPKLRSFEKALLQSMVGVAAGEYLYNIVRGKDPGIYSQTPRSRSISSEMTFEQDTRDRDVLNRVLLDISHQVMFRSINENFKTKTVALKLRYADFSTTTARLTLRHYISSAEEVLEVARQLLEKRWNGTELIRLVGISLSGLEKQAEPEQSELFRDEYDKKKKVEQAVLSFHQKHKQSSIVKASLLHKKRRNGPNPVE